MVETAATEMHQASPGINQADESQGPTDPKDIDIPPKQLTKPKSKRPKKVLKSEVNQSITSKVTV
jgi:hypothetical protein